MDSSYDIGVDLRSPLTLTLASQAAYHYTHFYISGKDSTVKVTNTFVRFGIWPQECLDLKCLGHRAKSAFLSCLISPCVDHAEGMINNHWIIEWTQSFGFFQKIFTVVCHIAVSYTGSWSIFGDKHEKCLLENNCLFPTHESPICSLFFSSHDYPFYSLSVKEPVDRTLQIS